MPPPRKAGRGERVDFPIGEHSVTTLAIVVLCAFWCMVGLVVAHSAGMFAISKLRDRHEAEKREMVQLSLAIQAQADQRATNALALLERQTSDLTAQILKLSTPKVYDTPGKSLSTDEADAAYMKEMAKTVRADAMIAGDPLTEFFGG